MVNHWRIDFGAGRLRAADADREQVAAELTRHCGEGRLTADELSERLELAYLAVTLGELDVLVADLPAEAPARSARRRVPTAGLAVVAALVALAAAGALALAAESPELALVLVGSLLLILLALVALVVPLVLAAAPFVLMSAVAVWAARQLRPDRGSLAAVAGVGHPPRARRRL